MNIHSWKVATVSLMAASLLVLVNSEVIIDAYPNTQPIPLGTTVMLECRVVGESSTVSYQWSCPNGACDVSSESRVTPRSRIVKGNTLTVNVVSESDGGEYRCTVTEGGNTQTSSYNITVSAGAALYKQESRTPLAVYQNGSVVTSESQVSSGFYHVAIKCVGGNSAPGTWSSPDGSDISTNSFSHVAQDRGELLVSNVETGYSNGNYKCRVGGSEAVIGLYLSSGSHVGTYSSSVSNFQANQTSSSSVRLSWDELTRPRSVTTVGYLVSYGRVDHGVRENMIIEGGSTTSVDLSNLHTGVEYEATIRGFSEDGTVRRVSTPVATTKWTIEDTKSYSTAQIGTSFASSTHPLAPSHTTFPPETSTAASSMSPSSTSLIMYESFTSKMYTSSVFQSSSLFTVQLSPSSTHTTSAHQMPASPSHVALAFSKYHISTSSSYRSQTYTLENQPSFSSSIIQSHVISTVLQRPLSSYSFVQKSFSTASVLSMPVFPSVLRSLSSNMKYSQSILKTTPSSPLIMFPPSTLQNFPSSTLQASPSSTLQTSPSSTLQTSPSSTLQASPSSTLQASPSSVLLSSPSSTLATTTSSTLRASPFSTLQTSPSSAFQISPSSTLQTSPSSAFQISPSSTLQTSPSSAFQTSPSSAFQTSLSPTLQTSLSSAFRTSPSLAIQPSFLSSFAMSPPSTDHGSSSSEQQDMSSLVVLPSVPHKPVQTSSQVATSSIMEFSHSLTVGETPTKPRSTTSTVSPEVSIIIGGVVGGILFIMLVIAIIIVIIVMAFICRVKKSIRLQNMHASTTNKYWELQDTYL